MYRLRNKYFKDNENKEVIELNIKTDSSNNKGFNRMQNTRGRASAVFSLKRNNDIIIKKNDRENSKEKDKFQNKEKEKEKEKNVNTNFQAKTSRYSGKPNFRWSVVEQRVEKEPTRWRRFNLNKIKEENKPIEQDLNKNITKNVEEIKKEKTPHIVKETIIKTTIIENNEKKPEEKLTKTEVIISKTKNEVEQIPKIKEENKDNKNEPKVIYRYRRGLVKPNKTDEDLPLNKKNKNEEVKVEAKKRRTLATPLIPVSRKLLEEKDNVNKKEEKNTVKNEFKIIPKNNIIIKEEKIEEDKNNLEKSENKNDDNKNEPIQKEKIKEDKDNYNLKKNKYKIDNNKNEITTKEKTEENKSKYNKDKNKNEIIKEEKIEENIIDTEQKEKLNRLKVALNEIEKVGAENILKKDLVEIYDKVLENNLDFKDNIFFKILNDTERKVGNMDTKPISHTYKEIETRKIVRHLDNAEGLMKKYTQKAKRIVEED